MTRQNQIPSALGEQSDMALIPYWDMCNHCNGRVGMVSSAYLYCSGIVGMVSCAYLNYNGRVGMVLTFIVISRVVMVSTYYLYCNGRVGMVSSAYLYCNRRVGMVSSAYLYCNRRVGMVSFGYPYRNGRVGMVSSAYIYCNGRVGMVLIFIVASRVPVEGKRTHARTDARCANPCTHTPHTHTAVAVSLFDGSVPANRDGPLRWLQ